MILKDWRWVPKGYPVLELEVIGETHTLTDVGEKLFDCYLGDILDECLDDHVWRFEVLASDVGEMALDSTIPILSQDMTAHELDPMEVANPQYLTCHPLAVGSEMIFCYDEGTTTRLAVKIESIERIQPTGTDALDQFPREKGAAAAASTEEVKDGDGGYGQTSSGTGEGAVTGTDAERSGLGAGAVPQGAGITIDQAFPHLKDVVLSKRYSAIFGICGDEMCGVVEGGPTDDGDQLYCPFPFETMEDYLICVNHAWPKIGEIMAQGETREGWVSLFVFPPQPLGAAAEAKVQSQARLLARLDQLQRHGGGRLNCSYAGSGIDPPTEFEFYMMCGARQVVCRMTVAELDAARATLRRGRVHLRRTVPGHPPVHEKRGPYRCLVREQRVVQDAPGGAGGGGEGHERRARGAAAEEGQPPGVATVQLDG